MCCSGVVLGRAVKRVQRKLASRRRREAEVGFAKRREWIALEAVEIARRRSLAGGERGGNMHRETEVAGFVRQAEARPDVTRCEQPLRQHRGEQDLTRLWLILAAQPIAPRMFERSITRLIALPLDGITGKLVILSDALWIFFGEERPLPAHAQVLQPFAAQAVGQRRASVSLQESAHPFGIRIVELDADAPVPNVRFEQMTFEPQRDPLQAHGVARAIRVPRSNKVRIVGLRSHREGNERKKRRTACDEACR